MEEEVDTARVLSLFQASTLPRFAGALREHQWAASVLEHSGVDAPDDLGRRIAGVAGALVEVQQAVEGLLAEALPSHGVDKASRGHVALAEYRFTTAVAASIACCAVDVIGIVRGLYVLTLRALHACAVEVALDAHGDDSAAADAPLLLFREPTDTLMNIGISMVNSLGRAGEESLAALMVALSALGLAAEARTALSAAVLDHVRARVLSLEDAWESPCLTALQQYNRLVVQPFLAAALGHAAEGRLRQSRSAAFKRDTRVLDAWMSKIDVTVYDSLLQMRIKQIFDIIKSLPDTAPAIQDMKACMVYSLHKRTLANELRQQLKARLLVPAADTPTIIEQYVGVVRVLRELDPTGAVLEHAGAPVRAYLRNSRSDTIRCLVSMLTGDASEGEGLDSLQEELTRMEAVDSDGDDADADAEVLHAASSWVPPPPEGSRDSRDLLTYLVGIYGNREQFLEEYRSLLASRLLSRHGFEVERDIRTLELLKMRFEDERMMHFCEVMLKDISDSKRLATALRCHSDWFGTLVISHEYWPTLLQEDARLPADVETAVQSYTEAFENFKKPRKLMWLKTAGSVNLEIEVDGVTKEFDVTPGLAAIVCHFQERESWPLGALAETCGVPEAVLQKRIAYWVSQGVVTEAVTGAGTVYTRAQTLEKRGGAWDDDDDAAEAAGGLASAQEDKAQKMAMHEQYIMGMLTNFDDGLPLSRIHNMLSMFVIDGSYTATEQDLSEFLGALVTDGKLALEGGKYVKKS